MAEKQQLLVVIGVTGLQGGSVARVFLQDPKWRIRGVTRDPSKATGKPLRDAGVELVAGDLDDPASLDRAFDGADAIFSVTDFWQFLQEGSSTFAEAEKAGRSPNEVAMDKEVQQGHNIVDAAARAHTVKPLHRFVLSNLSDSAKWSDGKIKWNLHFDGKAHYTDYLRSEYPELASKTSYLQMGYYLSNWQNVGMTAPHKVVAASGEEEIVLPAYDIPNAKPIPFVHPPNDTGHFVRALITSPLAPPGTTMVGGSEFLTTRETSVLLERVFGKKVKLEHRALDYYQKLGIPEWMALEISESGAYVSTYGWDGGEPGVKRPEEAGVDVTQLTSLETWLKSENWSALM